MTRPVSRSVTVMLVVANGRVLRVLRIRLIVSPALRLTNLRVALPLWSVLFLTTMSNLLPITISPVVRVTQGLTVEADRSNLRITPDLPFVTIRLMMRVLCFLASVAF